MILYSGLILHCIPAAMLFRPFTFWTGGKPFNPQAPQVKAPPATDDNSNPIYKPGNPENGARPDSKLLEDGDHLRPRALTGSSVGHMSGHLSKSKSSLYASHHSLAFSPHQEAPPEALEEDGVAEPEPEPTPPKTGCEKACGCCAMFDWGLFKNWLFVIYVCGLSCGHGGYINVCMFLPAYAVENGVGKEMVAILLGVVGMSDLVGRVLGGWFADLGKCIKK